MKSRVRQRVKTQTLEKGFRLRKIRLLPMKSSAQQHAGALSLEQKGSDATNSPQFNSPQTAQTMTDRETARDKNQDKNKEERQRDKRQRNRDKETEMERQRRRDRDKWKDKGTDKETKRHRQRGAQSCSNTHPAILSPFQCYTYSKTLLYRIWRAQSLTSSTAKNYIQNWVERASGFLYYWVCLDKVSLHFFFRIRKMSKRRPSKSPQAEDSAMEAEESEDDLIGNANILM